MFKEERRTRFGQVAIAALTLLALMGSLVLVTPDAAAMTFDDPLTSSYVKIRSGTGSFSGVSDSSKQIQVEGGTDLWGSVNLETFNGMEPSNRAPLISTPSWGSHSSSYQEINNWIGTGTWNYNSGEISLTAPTAPGTYYIIFAFNAEFTAEEVASSTNWRYADVHGVVWNDGNDVAGLSGSKISQMQSSGRTTVLYKFDGASQAWTMPGDAITIVVGQPGTVTSPFTTSHVKLQSGTGSFSSISSSSKQITVKPGSAITGAVTVEAQNGAGYSVGPLIATPSWGTASSSFWVVRDAVTGGTFMYTTSGIDLVAPSTAGTYYLIFAFSDEHSGAQLASCTNWQYWSGEVWGDGNDLAKLSSGQISTAQSTGRVSVSYLFDSGSQPYVIPVDAVKIVVKSEEITHFDDLLTGSYVKIQSGTGSFSSISSSSKQITVKPGASLSGSVAMLAKNDLKSTDSAPLIGLTTWGAHSGSYWTVKNWISTGTNSYVSSGIDVTAPSTEGTYYLIFSFNAEMNGEQVASSTNWRHSGVVWNDGNDLADLPASKIAQAQSTGRTTVSYTFTTWSQSWSVPADAIRIVVSASSDGTKVVKGTVSGKLVYTNGDPVAGATVKLPSGESAVTDEDGWFSIDLTAGSYKLTMVKEGCVDRQVQVSVGSGQSSYLGDISMQQGASETPTDGGHTSLLPEIPPWAFIAIALAAVAAVVLVIVLRR